MKQILIVVILSSLSACGGLGEFQRPCTVPNVKIHFLSDQAAMVYCEDVLHAKPDPGETPKLGTTSGCFARYPDGRAEIVISESGGTYILAHEIRHLTDSYCNSRQNKLAKKDAR